MRNYVMKNLYKQAVQYFGADNYRKAFNCTSYLAVLQADYRIRRNPVSLRLSTIDELRETLKLKINKINGINESFSNINVLGELIPLMGDGIFLLHNLFNKIGVTGSCDFSIIFT